MNTLFLLFSTLAFCASPTLDRIEQACLKNGEANGQSLEANCRCMKENYARKLDDAGIAQLWKLQQGQTPKTEVNEELVDFDLDVTEHCAEDASWRWVAPRPEPKPELKAKAETKSDVKTAPRKKAGKPRDQGAKKP